MSTSGHSPGRSTRSPRRPISAFVLVRQVEMEQPITSVPPMAKPSLERVCPQFQKNIPWPQITAVLRMHHRTAICDGSLSSGFLTSGRPIFWNTSIGLSSSQFLTNLHSFDAPDSDASH